MDDVGGDGDGDGGGNSSYSTGRIWTNEKHVNFLNSMEATFVRTMLVESYSSSRHDHLRLDRYLPDSLESTLDSRPKTAAAAAADGTFGCRSRSGGSADHKRSRRSSLSSSSRTTRSHITQNSNSQHDQVVPHLSKTAD